MKLELFRKELPPSARIRSLLAYDLRTGEFNWKRRDDVSPSTAARLEGKRAGGRTAQGYIVMHLGSFGTAAAASAAYAAAAQKYFGVFGRRS